MGCVFLVRPRWKYPLTEENYTYNRISFPLSLSYCSSLLKMYDVPVRLLDFHGMRDIDIQTWLSEIGPDDVVFVTSSDIEHWLCPQLDLRPFLDIISLIKKRSRHLYVIGPHGTMDPERILGLTGARAVVRGEPEYAVLRLALHDSLDSVPGLSYRMGGKTVHTPQGDDLVLDELPFPDPSLLKSVDYPYEVLGGRVVLIESTRNCLFSCAFCYKGMFGKTYRLKSVRRVIEEIRMALRSGARRGTFIDLDIGIDRTHLESLCHALREQVPGFEWCCQTRAENLDEELISLMSQAGCRLIAFGIESADQHQLERLKKRIEPQTIRRVLDACRRHRIHTLGCLLVGLPGESIEDAQRTLAYGLALGPTYLLIHLVTGFKGTSLYDELGGADDWHRLEPSPEKRARLRKMIRKTYLKHYLRPSSILERFSLRRLPGFLSEVRMFWSYLR